MLYFRGRTYPCQSVPMAMSDHYYILSKFSNQDKKPRERWGDLVVAWRKAYQMIGKKKSSDRVKEEGELQRNLNFKEKELQLKGFEYQLENQLVYIKGNLRRIQ